MKKKDTSQPALGPQSLDIARIVARAERWEKTKFSLQVIAVAFVAPIIIGIARIIAPGFLDWLQARSSFQVLCAFGAYVLIVVVISRTLQYF